MSAKTMREFRVTYYARARGIAHVRARSAEDAIARFKEGEHIDDRLIDCDDVEDLKAELVE